MTQLHGDICLTPSCFTTRFLSPCQQIMTRLHGDLCQTALCFTTGFRGNLIKGASGSFHPHRVSTLLKGGRGLAREARKLHGEAMSSSGYTGWYGLVMLSIPTMVMLSIPTLDILAYIQIAGVLKTIKTERAEKRVRASSRHRCCC